MQSKQTSLLCQEEHFDKEAKMCVMLPIATVRNIETIKIIKHQQQQQQQQNQLTFTQQQNIQVQPLRNCIENISPQLPSNFIN